MLGLVMKPGFNGLKLGKALNAEEVAIHHELPTGITFAKITDQAKVIDDAIHEFMVKFFTALSVVIFGQPGGARLPRRHRRGPGRAADAFRRVRHDDGSPAAISTASRWAP